MIRSLRRRFLVIAMLSLAGTLFLLCLAINLGCRLVSTHRADTVIGTLHQNAGSFPSPEEVPPDPGGHIRLALSRRGRGVQLTLSNPCASLDPSVIPKLFDRFYRADNSRARDSGGCGIGLSTARAIVQRHRGKLTARGMDGGIQFTAFFPL